MASNPRSWRWNIVFDQTHNVLARVLVGPGTLRPRIPLRLLGLAVGVPQEQVDAQIRGALDALKAWRMSAVADWIGSGILHQNVAGMAMQYAMRDLVQGATA